MENNRTEILRELEAELAALKEKVLQFETKLEAFRQLPEEEPVEESDFTDLEIGVPDLPEPVDEPAPIPELVEGPEPQPEPVEMDFPADDLPEPVPEPIAEPVPVPEPVEGPEPEPQPEPEPAPKPAPVLPRPETERLPWRLDKPGLSVKHIRSGISMYDRALFIGTLFKEDYALYDKTIGELDALTSLDEAVDYLLERFPDWNLKSDIVYNFMMAIRKKLG
ncbi:MAG: hypothetical protein IJK29_06880 [Bacteroidales bacterium]|nr:hypothetical protein [Bacteroidales bacterium]